MKYRPGNVHDESSLKNGAYQSNEKNNNTNNMKSISEIIRWILLLMMAIKMKIQAMRSRTTIKNKYCS